MTLSEELKWRGFINQTTLGDLKLLDTKKWIFYNGFDASSDSQAIGNLAAMMLNRLFMRHGHQAIILAGGATSLIGDPGGKDAERSLQPEKVIAHNIVLAEKQLKKVFKGYQFKLVNNLDWTKQLSVIHFLRDVGKHFSMTPLVQRDYIARRIGQDGAGISYAEFSYTLLQGMDFLHLFDKYGCNLQLGGSDQWGNCLSGVELIRRARGAEAHVITLPLIINKASGKKFGKSEEGAVWLDPAKTSPTQFYQFWINLDDDGIEGYLKIFTELNKSTIDQVMTDHHNQPEKRLAQHLLAQEVTGLVHDQQTAQQAELITQYLTTELPLEQADRKSIDIIRREQPSARSVTDGSIAEALVNSHLVDSKAEARRLISDLAISINGQRANREHFKPEDFKAGRLLLRKGKKFKDSALIEAA
ncbi:MAG TPA: tyrosine--tRNA ligase [Candidatus Dormibacteraeota bacterium]|nr:tyrosine--tRNA ligase [Candidatus Dormibacteraeota bacterium]